MTTLTELDSLFGTMDGEDVLEFCEADLTLDNHKELAAKLEDCIEEEEEELYTTYIDNEGTVKFTVDNVEVQLNSVNACISFHMDLPSYDHDEHVKLHNQTVLKYHRLKSGKATVKELRSFLKEIGIHAPSKLRKRELIDLI